MEGSQGGPHGGVPPQQLQHRPLERPQLLRVLRAQRALPRQLRAPPQHLHHLYRGDHRLERKQACSEHGFWMYNACITLSIHRAREVADAESTGWVMAA